MDILHTEGTLARFAVEMNMPVVMIASPFFFAEFVAEYASPIFEGMYHIMFQKEGKGTEDARLIHRNHLSFQIAQTLRVLFAHRVFITSMRLAVGRMPFDSSLLIISCEFIVSSF